MPLSNGQSGAKLVTFKAKPKRSRALKILLRPATGVIFVLGWILYCFGENKQSSKIRNKPHNIPQQKDYVTIGPILREEAPEIKEHN